MGDGSGNITNSLEMIASFHQSISDKIVTVKLINSDHHFRGVITNIDSSLGITMIQPEEYIEGQLRKRYDDDAFIVGNEVYYICSSLETKEEENNELEAKLEENNELEAKVEENNELEANVEESSEQISGETSYDNASVMARLADVRRRLGKKKKKPHIRPLAETSRPERTKHMHFDP